MFYYLYQITNLVNNKIYVGVHKTHKFDDGYMGSGKVIGHFLPLVVATSKDFGSQIRSLEAASLV